MDIDMERFTDNLDFTIPKVAKLLNRTFVPAASSPE